MPETQDRRLRDYVLGNLPVQGRGAVEAEIFESTSAFEQVELMEAEIIRDYVVGALPPHEAAVFTQKLAENPALQTKVEEDKRLARALTSLPAPAPVSPPALRERIADWFRLPILQFATTAAAIAAIGIALWQASELTQVHGRLEAALGDQERMRSDMTTLSARATPPPVGLLLGTRLDRSSSQPRFVVPPAQTPVELRLAPDTPRAAAYRISVETAEGDVIASGQASAPTLTLPGGILKPRQEYVVQVETVSADGTVTRLRSLTFSTAAQP